MLGLVGRQIFFQSIFPNRLASANGVAASQCWGRWDDGSFFYLSSQTVWRVPTALPPHNAGVGGMTDLFSIHLPKPFGECQRRCRLTMLGSVGRRIFSIYLPKPFGECQRCCRLTMLGSVGRQIFSIFLPKPFGECQRRCCPTMLGLVGAEHFYLSFLSPQLAR